MSENKANPERKGMATQESWLFKCLGQETPWRQARRRYSRLWKATHKRFMKEYEQRYKQERRGYMREYMRQRREAKRAVNRGKS